MVDNRSIGNDRAATPGGELRRRRLVRVMHRLVTDVDRWLP
ncbi:hypothetical protein [Desulfoprunum benzoelyticum]|nr:hypothetical protein [Desulfoprunum benzoelyticum]